MPESFHDMVLQPMITERIGQTVGRIDQRIAIAQHEADMAHEIACPVCIGGAYSWIENGELRHCLTCNGTGRVTLGALVAADRAPKWKAEITADKTAPI